MLAKTVLFLALLYGLGAVTTATRGGIDPFGNPAPEPASGADEGDTRGGIDPWG